MKVQNKNNIGNPYHDEEGKFTSENNLGSSGENQNSSIEKIKGLILGEDYSQNNEENYDFGDLDNFIDNFDLDDYFNELENQQKNDDENTEKKLENKEEKNNYKNILENLSDSDYIEQFELISEQLDLNKISSLSIEEQKKIIDAYQMLANKHLDNEYLELEKLNQKTFYNLWIDPVKPSDYEEKKDKIINKKNYFALIYTGDDADEKIAQIIEFKNLGEQYLAKKEQIDAKYENAQNLIQKYEKEEYIYGQKRKDNAIWINSSSVDENLNQSIKEFSSVQSKVFEKLNKENPKYAQSVYLYSQSYSSFNEPLRNINYYGTKQKKDEFIENVENVTYAISQSSYGKDIWLQRGTSRITIDKNLGLEINSSTSIKDLKKLVGREFIDEAFVSCGAAKNTGFDEAIKMNIYCPAGTNMLFLADKENKYSYYGKTKENEMLLQRGYHYKITKVEKKNGQIYIDCDCILGSDKNKYDSNQLKEIKEKYFV